MIDLWLKAFHLIAVVVWLGGMIFSVVALFLGGTHQAHIGPLIRKLNALLTTPAMFAVWALGITLAQQAGWWSSGWLQAKLVLVVVLSAIHGILSGKLARNEQLTGGAGRYLCIGLATFPIVIMLAVLKPF